MTVTKSRLNEEVPGHQKGFRFKIQFERHLSLKALKLSKYPVYNPVQGKFIYHEALKLSNPVQNPAQGKICPSQIFEAFKSGLKFQFKKN